MKRPTDDTTTEQPCKKTRTNTILEEMKSTMESLLKTADEHHEEARIAAVDVAFELEQQLSEVTGLVDSYREEDERLKTEYSTVSQYMGTVQKSMTVKMLDKAVAYQLDNKKLSEDHQKMTETMAKMQELSQKILDDGKHYELLLSKKLLEETELKEKLMDAEKKVTLITDLNI